MRRTVFFGASVFDGTGAVPFAADIAVEDGRIVAVGSGLQGEERIDCTGLWISPGFIDCHVHVVSDGLDVVDLMDTPFSYQFYVAGANLKRTLDTGITTTRDAAGADLGIKQAVESGLIPGPRMQISLSAITQTGGHGDDWHVCGARLPIPAEHPGVPSGLADGTDEVRRKVRELVRAGADVIKVCTSGGVLSPRTDPRHGHFRDAEIAVMVEEATAAGLSVMAHAQGTDGIKTAVRNGVRSIEHGIYLDDEAITMMVDRGTWLVPTLHAGRAVLRSISDGVDLPASVIEKARNVTAAHEDSVRRAHAAGVKIAMGTDCGVGTHGTNLEELELLVAVGLSPLEALGATTASAAELLGIAHDRGTIAVGKRADLTVLAGPVGSVGGLADRVRGVYLDGVIASHGKDRARTDDPAVSP